MGMHEKLGREGEWVAKKKKYEGRSRETKKKGREVPAVSA